MKLLNFLHLNHQQRTATTINEGTFLMSREGGAFTINLYAVNDYYTEVWYRKTDRTVELVRGFKSIELLNPYLEKINLSELATTYI